MASNRAFCSAIPNQRPHISLFPPYSRWILPCTGERRYLSLPHFAASPPCKCRPKCPIFAAHSAAKESATRDSCPLLGKSASSHPHFFTDSITKRICNRFHVRSFLQRCKNQANSPDLSVQRFDGTISTPRVRSSMLRKERRKPAMPILA